MLSALDILTQADLLQVFTIRAGRAESGKKCVTQCHNAKLTASSEHCFAAEDDENVVFMCRKIRHEKSHSQIIMF